MDALPLNSQFASMILTALIVVQAFSDVDKVDGEEAISFILLLLPVFLDFIAGTTLFVLENVNFNLKAHLELMKSTNYEENEVV